MSYMKIRIFYLAEIIASTFSKYLLPNYISSKPVYKILTGKVMPWVIAAFCLLLTIMIAYFSIRKITQLNKNGELFKALFQQAPIGILFGDKNKNIIDVNPMYEKIIDRSKDRILNLSWKEFTHPDDLTKDMTEYNRYINGEIDGYSLLKRYIKPDNSIVWVNLTLSRLRLSSDSNMHHICIVEDVTNKIQVETALQDSQRITSVLLSNLPGMVYRCKYDKDWTMKYVSDGCYDLTGYTPESLLNNRDMSFNDIINVKYRDYLWEKWRKVLASKSVFKDEYEITTASGEIKWVFEQGHGVYDDNGEIIALEGLIIDITEQKKREEEVRYLQFHDILTGLYNRQYYEEEIKRIDDDSHLPISIIIGDINGLKLVNEALGYEKGDNLLITIANVIKSCCRKDDIITRIGGDEFCILMPKTTNDTALKIVKQIEKKCEEYKLEEEGYHMSISMGCATKLRKYELISNTLKDAEDRMYLHKLLQSHSYHSTIISSMKATLFAKSQETEEHANRLITLSREIGLKLKLRDTQLNELELLSTLHDIGKIGINDNILNKPGKLTDEEWVIMKKHPEIGYRIAMSSPELAPIAEYILYHHERWDGNGYPQGLAGDKIPLLSRILSVVDAYDAMTEDRIYRKTKTKEEAIEEIVKCSGTQFDPTIVDIFLNIDSIKKIYRTSGGQQK